MTKEKVMTPMQQRLLEHYLVHGKATKAAIEAGYEGNDNAASVYASRIIHSPKGQRYMMTRRQEIAEIVGLTTEYKLRKIKEGIEAQDIATPQGYGAILNGINVANKMTGDFDPIEVSMELGEKQVSIEDECRDLLIKVRKELSHGNGEDEERNDEEDV